MHEEAVGDEVPPAGPLAVCLRPGGGEPVGEFAGDVVDLGGELAVVAALGGDDFPTYAGGAEVEGFR